MRLAQRDYFGPQDVIPNDSDIETATPPAELARAIIATLVYSDLFDYPLRADEITRYLIGCKARPAEVTLALRDNPELAQKLATRDGFYFLAGRESIVATRRARAAKSARLWGRARRYVRLVALLPFVRMVAVSGALAMNNVGSHEDIDLLIVTRPGRVWITRRLAVFAVHLSRALGDELCPNYLLADDALELSERDLFTAHELAQMVPLYGRAIHREMMRHNGWALELLPNAWPAPPTETIASLPRPALLLRGLVEGALSLTIFDAWERRELRRMSARLTPTDSDGEVAFNPSRCKGHTGLYRQQVLRRYEVQSAKVTSAK